MKTASEIIDDVRNMESAERWKLVRDVNNFTNSPNKETADIIMELLDEISGLKKDIEYLSGKVGLHEMYFNRNK
ncbi:hypothetical protein [Rossellomorea yichunensis]|uniref:hypothetical protein n=1 Tax=Rossellomorea yichunensis TaxID=3077331 RepID=UPI0028DD7B92|nr:hypothetical protein [Rossellomorea sp. YC4-1]MDT9023325.1 hypothetical protein [Rossellomorea sp. YC4-1]